jgi:hypothetical protein
MGERRLELLAEQAQVLGEQVDLLLGPVMEVELQPCQAALRGSHLRTPLDGVHDTGSPVQQA